MASGAGCDAGLLTYAGGWPDRVGGRRADAKWLDELLNSPDTTLIPFWRDQGLMSGDPSLPVRLHAARADRVVLRDALTTVSIRIARPSLRYYLTRECL